MASSNDVLLRPDLADLELNAFSNPFVANGWSTRPTMSASSNGQGAWLDVTWTVPNDQGLPYAAPFALGAQTTALVGGHFARRTSFRLARSAVAA